MKCEVCLLGNHDQGALFDPEGFNTGAERAIFWTRAQLENSGSGATASCPAVGRKGSSSSFTVRPAIR